MLFGKHDMLKAVAELGTEKILFFNDLMGGSPYNAACRLVAQNENYVIVAGVNLPGLIALSAAQDMDDGSASIADIAAQALDSFMCVSDEVAKDELRKKLLLQVVPPGLKGYVIPVDKAVEAYKNPKYNTFKTLFPFTNPTDVVRAVKGGIPSFTSINLGGKCFKDVDTLI